MKWINKIQYIAIYNLFESMVLYKQYIHLNKMIVIYNYKCIIINTKDTGDSMKYWKERNLVNIMHEGHTTLSIHTDINMLPFTQVIKKYTTYCLEHCTFKLK